MNKNNAEFYVKKNYLAKKLGKVKRDIKVKKSAFVSILQNDFSSKKLDISWKEKPTRYDLINKLIADNNYQNYLEIGCSRDDCFQAIAAPNKIGVDPFSGGTHRMTSDDFFKTNTQKFDIVFIDGLHQYAQVRDDMLNSIAALSDNGVILIHDCLPLNYKAQLPFPPGGDWNGDVWKSICQMRSMSEIDTAVALIDHGVGIIKKRPNRNLLELNAESFYGLKFKNFINNYQAWLNTLSYEDSLKFING